MVTATWTQGCGQKDARALTLPPFRQEAVLGSLPDRVQRSFPARGAADWDTICWIDCRIVAWVGGAAVLAVVSIAGTVVVVVDCVVDLNNLNIVRGTGIVVVVVVVVVVEAVVVVVLVVGALVIIR